ncbi:MAG: CBS domain-containing protein [Dehalococcoidales bacterium]|nr:CBS domain-containing protein [Dehalococcoidales bacterium]
MKVKEIGIKEVHYAEPSTILSEIASIMKKHDVGIIPVCEGKKLLGVLTDRDLVVRCMAAAYVNPKACTAREIMTSNPITVTPDTDLEEVARIMGREQIRRLPVVETGNLVGMISLGDISIGLSNNSLVAETLSKISMPAHAKVRGMAATFSQK